MEFWPTDNRIHAGKTNAKTNRKGKGKAAPSGVTYLEPGRLEAVTLVEKKSRFEWTTTVQSSGGPRLTLGPSVQLLPPSRPPPLNVPSTSITQRTEHIANFVREKFPDLEVAAELIREEVSADDRIARELKHYDPASGNALELLDIPETANVTKYLAYPSGITGCDLNISPFVKTEEQGVTFKPVAQPHKSFASPILQLTSSQFRNQSSFLSVRTYGATMLMNVRLSSDQSALKLSESIVITRDDIGQRPVMDTKVSPSRADAFIVNDHGVTYKYDLESKVKSLAHDGSKKPDGGDKFWRLALAGASEDGCLITSSKIVQELDFRATNSALDILSLPSNELATCIEDSGDDYIVRLSTTERVLWLDRRFAGRPLFGIKHHRAHDRTLNLRTLSMLSMHGKQHTLMTSRKNKLITVYDVSRSAESLFTMENGPSALSIDVIESRFSGNAYLTSGNECKLLRMSERGAISSVDLKLDDCEDIPESARAPQIHQTQNTRPDNGPLEARACSVENLRPAYEHLFPSLQHITAQEEKDADAVYDVLEQLPTFWQQLDSPAEHVLTTYDILFRAGEEPEHPSRADILTGSVFNSASGYRALLRDRGSMDSLKNDAAWHSDIAPVIGHLDASTSGDIHTVSERLRTFDLSPHLGSPVQASRRQKMAREQLALDLSLSKDVFSPKRFSSYAGKTETMGSVDFHYSNPIPKRDHYSRKDDEDDEGLDIPHGVRSLMADWDVGTDPEKYLYQDQYGNDAQVKPEGVKTARQRKETHAQSQATASPRTVTSQVLQPPSIIPFPATQIVIPGVESQMTLPDEPESQGLMTSTQVLPGPFGGRQSLGKKKPTKKRMGGF